MKLVSVVGRKMEGPVIVSLKLAFPWGFLIPPSYWMCSSCGGVDTKSRRKCVLFYTHSCLVLWCWSDGPMGGEKKKWRKKVTFDIGHRTRWVLPINVLCDSASSWCPEDDDQSKKVLAPVVPTTPVSYIYIYSRAKRDIFRPHVDLIFQSARQLWSQRRE